MSFGTEESWGRVVSAGFADVEVWRRGLRCPGRLGHRRTFLEVGEVIRNFVVVMLRDGVEACRLRGRSRKPEFWTAGQ